MIRPCVECGEAINPKRADLGYNTCIDCAKRTGTSQVRTVVPLSKSNYVLVTNVDDLKGLNPKRVGE